MVPYPILHGVTSLNDTELKEKLRKTLNKHLTMTVNKQLPYDKKQEIILELGNKVDRIVADWINDVRGTY